MKKQVMVVMMALAVMTAGGGMALAYNDSGDRQARGPWMGDCPMGMECPGMMGQGMGMGHGMGHGMGMMGPHRMPPLPPEKQKAYQEIMKAFGPKFSELHDQFMVKRMELNALSRNPNATPEIISRTSAELGAIMAEMRKEQQAFRDRFEKEVGPLPAAPMMGPHHGKRGVPGRGGMGPGPALPPASGK